MPTDMKNLTLIATLSMCIGAQCAGGAYAQQKTASQLLTLVVRPMTRLVVSDDPRPLIITREAGSTAAQSISDRHTRYSLLTNQEEMKISASIDRAMPQGTSLRIQLASSGGVSKGEVDISKATAPAEVVTGIGRGFESDQSITYTFTADPTASDVDSDARTITLTVTN